MNSNKMLSMILALVLIASILAGCSNNSAVPAETAATSPSDVSQSPEVSPEPSADTSQSLSAPEPEPSVEPEIVSAKVIQ